MLHVHQLFGCLKSRHLFHPQKTALLGFEKMILI